MRMKFDPDEASLSWARTQKRGAVPITDEVETLLIALLDAAIGYRGDRIFIGNDHLRTAVRSSEVGLCWRHSNLTLEDPERLNVGFQFFVGFNKSQLHYKKYRISTQIVA